MRPTSDLPKYPRIVKAMGGTHGVERLFCPDWGHCAAQFPLSVAIRVFPWVFEALFVYVIAVAGEQNPWAGAQAERDEIQTAAWAGGAHELVQNHPSAAKPALVSSA